jgi:hypothetical protein
METATKTRLTLRDLADEARALDELYAMDEGEVTPESEALEAELMGKLIAKTDAFCTFVKTLEAHAEIVDAEAGAVAKEVARLKAKSSAITNKVERLKRYADAQMTAMRSPKLTGELYTLTQQKSPPSLQLTARVEDLPAEYVRVVPETKAPDKPAIIAALKAGAEIAGAELMHSTHVRIR